MGIGWSFTFKVISCQFSLPIDEDLLFILVGRRITVSLWNNVIQCFTSNLLALLLLKCQMLLWSLFWSVWLIFSFDLHDLTEAPHHPFLHKVALCRPGAYLVIAFFFVVVWGGVVGLCCNYFFSILKNPLVPHKLFGGWDELRSETEQWQTEQQDDPL